MHDNEVDFDLVKKKSIGYFKSSVNQGILTESTSDNLSPVEKARFGFYFLVLEIKTGVSDLRELDRMILDTKYLKDLHEIDNDDWGIDAVYIDEEHTTINLFNFKYRENYKRGASISDGIIGDARTFISAIQNGGADLSDKITSRTIQTIKTIQKAYSDSEKDWTTKLVLVSNEDNNFPQDAFNRNSLYLKKNHLELDGFVLPDIVDALIERPGTGQFVSSAKIRVKNDEIMHFDSINNGKVSFLVKLTMADVIRMFSRNPDKRDKYNFEEYSDFQNEKLDSNFLFENVRGFLTKSGYNKGIYNTLVNEPSSFFLFNNGLTLVCDSVDQKSVSGGNGSVLTIHNYQVVNGGQTVRTIFNANEQSFSESRLDQVEVLARIFSTDDPIVRSKIAEYTNSQNAISPIDLKSTDEVQLRIEQILKTNNIVYIRKAGDLDKVTDKGQRSITLEVLGQILYSINGYPDKATNQKKRIFTDQYDNLFPSDINILNKIPNYCQEFFDNEKELACTKQENLYLMYILHRASRTVTPNQAYDSLHEVEREFRSKDDISPARKLIQTAFKDELDTKLINEGLFTDEHQEGPVKAQ